METVCKEDNWNDNYALINMIIEFYKISKHYKVCVLLEAPETDVPPMKNVPSDKRSKFSLLS